jgi:hypothetical protein
VLTKHITYGVGVDFLGLSKQAISLIVVTDRLFMQALFSESAGLYRRAWVCTTLILLAIRHAAILL